MLVERLESRLLLERAVHAADCVIRCRVRWRKRGVQFTRVVRGLATPIGFGLVSGMRRWSVALCFLCFFGRITQWRRC
jgi:hypothetical protein